MSRDNWPTGLVTALVSPMKGDDIYLIATQQLIESQVQAGAGGVLVAGGTGEHGALSFAWWPMPWMAACPSSSRLELSPLAMP